MECNICEKNTDEVILPIVKGENITYENMCDDCYSQYENLLTVRENKKNLMTRVDEEIHNRS